MRGGKYQKRLTRNYVHGPRMQPVKLLEQQISEGFFLGMKSAPG